MQIMRKRSSCAPPPRHSLAVVSAELVQKTSSSKTFYVQLAHRCDVRATVTRSTKFWCRQNRTLQSARDDQHTQRSRSRFHYRHLLVLLSRS
jgi:hypothetical protein